MNYIEFLFWVSALLIFITWIMYPILIFLCSKFIKLGNNKSIDYYMPVSVIIAAHNEEKIIKQKIEDVYSGIYPSSLLELIVASDGSSDATVVLSKRLIKKFPTIKVLDIRPQRGRANAHNSAVKIAKGDILVFTDADTKFDRYFLREIVAAFNNQNVGFASGRLEYLNTEEADIQKNVNIYWKFELWMRECESRLGLLTTGSGACCAVRKSLYREIPPTGDVDFTTPLDVVKAGFVCKYIPEAIAFDFLPNTPQAEFKARVRMTAKNFHGTLARWGIKGFLLHPLCSISLLFHKIFRWLTPYFMLFFLMTNIFILDLSPFYIVSLSVQGVFYLWGLLGFLKISMPGTSFISNFIMANMAFFYGVNKALFGSVPSVYKPVGQS